MLSTILILLGSLSLVFICVLLYMSFNNKKEDIDAILNKYRSTINPSHQNKQQKPTESDRVMLLIDEVKKLKKEVGDLKQKVIQVETRRNQDIKAINDSFDVISKRITSVSSKKSVDEKQSTAMMIAGEKRNIITKKYPQVVYAHYADSENPIGFSQSLLKMSPEGCFFKIIIYSPTQASFSLIDNEGIMINAIQALATIVNPCCNYEISEPITNRYKTISEGKLIKVNHLWQVESKSKISFL